MKHNYSSCFKPQLLNPDRWLFLSSGVSIHGMEDLKKRIGDSFRTARLRMGLTQEALAEKVGVTTETISNSERGESLVTLPIFLNIAGALELDLEDIVATAPATKRKMATKRLRLEGDLRQLGRDLPDSDLELLIGIGRMVRQRGKPNTHDK